MSFHQCTWTWDEKHCRWIVDANYNGLTQRWYLDQSIEAKYGRQKLEREFLRQLEGTHDRLCAEDE